MKIDRKKYDSIKGIKHATPEVIKGESMTNQDYIPVSKQVGRLLNNDLGLYDTKEREELSDEVLDREDRTRSGDFDFVDMQEAKLKLKAKMDKIKKAQADYKAEVEKQGKEAVRLQAEAKKQAEAEKLKKDKETQDIKDGKK